MSYTKIVEKSFANINMQKFPVTLFSVGCTLLITALIAGWIIIPLTIHNRVENEISLGNGSLVGHEWRNPEQKIYFTVYVFNVTNPEEIESGGEPLIDELGPYVFREKKERRILEENGENDTIKFVETRTYYFDEELSNGREDDVICTLNLPYVAVAQQLSTYSTMMRWLASTYISKFKSTVFMQLSVKEFLFEGIYQPMIYEIEQITGQVYLPNSTFGMFYGRNGSENGEMEIYSGVQDSSRIGATISWKGKNQLDYWPASDYCNMLNGSDATVFPPFVTKESKLYFFNPDLCRSAYVTYKKETEIMGIPGYIFTPPPSITSVDNPHNRCFCHEKTVAECPGNGVYQLKSCQQDAPLLLSFPHFLQGDSEYADKFHLKPENELHESQIVLEPTTGIPLKINLRVQLNVDLKRLPKDNKFKHVQNMVFPLLWLDENYVISEENALKMQKQLITPLEVIEWTKWMAFGCSFSLIFISTFVFLVRVRRKSVFV